MGKTSKSPLTIIRDAYKVGEAALPKRWHRFSPKTFSPAQLFSCLVLRAFFLVDYRGMEVFLTEFPNLLEAVGMKKAPDYSTLCKAEKRLFGQENTCCLLQQTIELALSRNRMKELVELSAIDGSGFESRHVSDYFRKRQNLKNKVIPHKKHPKMSIVIDTKSHMILGIRTGRGPKPDIVDLEPLLKQVQKKTKIKCIVADAGYDSERSHIFARKICGIRSIIPPLIGRRTSKLPTGFYRRLMATRFDAARYGQRWQVETVFSMLKRLLRSALSARNYHSQSRELRLKAITLNIMLLFFALIELFNRA